MRLGAPHEALEHTHTRPDFTHALMHLRHARRNRPHRRPVSIRWRRGRLWHYGVLASRGLKAMGKECDKAKQLHQRLLCSLLQEGCVATCEHRLRRHEDPLMWDTDGPIGVVKFVTPHACVARASKRLARLKQPVHRVHFLPFLHALAGPADTRGSTASGWCKRKELSSLFLRLGEWDSGASMRGECDVVLLK
eukprot:2590698-Prymnesium_polylepis.1